MLYHVETCIRVHIVKMLKEEWHTGIICRHSWCLNQAGVSHCLSTWKTKSFSLVFPGSRVSCGAGASKHSPSPPSFAPQLLGAGGESGSPGRLPCPPPPLFLLLLCPIHPPPSVGHLISERRTPPPFAPLPHPPTPLGAEDGLQGAGRKREEQRWRSSLLLLLLLVQASPCAPRLSGASSQGESSSGRGQDQQHLLPRPQTPPQVQRLWLDEFRVQLYGLQLCGYFCASLPNR